MLYIALVMSALLLLIVNTTAFRVRTPGPWIVGFSLGAIFMPCFPAMAFPPVMMQGLLFCLVVGVWSFTRRGPVFFLAFSGVSTLIAYSVAGVNAYQHEQEYARLRARYPFESLETRLPTPKPSLIQPPTASVAATGTGPLDDPLSILNTYRSFNLKRLHEHSVELFIDSPSFGVARMSYLREWDVQYRRGPVPAQPAPRLASTWSPGDLGTTTEGETAPLRKLLDGSLFDFLDPQGFGYVKDRRHVAGFEPHQFSRVPGPEDRWEVRRLELVSLLLHDEPVVYVSDHLPAMSREHNTPTRPLDRFESYGLDALRRGEALVVSLSGASPRMLGALASNAACVQCHGGSPGDLLGAFSYALRRVPAPDPEQKSPMTEDR